MILNIGEKIKQKRLEKKVTQQQLADFVSVSKASVSKWESGHSYPDITLLPLIAAYFDLTIDQLMNHNTQLTSEEIQHLLNTLRKEALIDTEITYQKVIRLTKSYWTCYPLIAQMGLFLMNYHTYFKPIVQEEILYQKITELFTQVIQHSHDNELNYLCKNSLAALALLHQHPEAIFDEIGNHTPILLNPEVLIANAYLLQGQIGKAEEVLQASLYQYLALMLNTFSTYLPLLKEQPKKATLTIERIQQFIKTFNLELLHPFTTLPVYLQFVFYYLSQQQINYALDSVEKIINLIDTIPLPFSLKGDDYFDHVSQWITQQSYGASTPRDQSLILTDLKKILDLPPFSALQSNDRYLTLKNQLHQVIERKETQHE